MWSLMHSKGFFVGILLLIEQFTPPAEHIYLNVPRPGGTSVLCNPAKTTFPKLTRSELFPAVIATPVCREEKKNHELLQLGLLESQKPASLLEPGCNLQNRNSCIHTMWEKNPIQNKTFKRQVALAQKHRFCNRKSSEKSPFS